MKLWTAWLARLGLVGSCLLWAGCGGSDVPDPDSDSKAAGEAAPGGGGAAPPAVAAGAEAPPAEAAPSAAVAKRGGPAAASLPGAAGEAGAGAGAAAAPATDESAPAVKSDGSATSEMLALANAPAPAPGGDKPAEGEAAGQPGGPGGPGGAPGGYPGPPGGGPAGYPGAPGVGGPGGSAGMMAAGRPGGPGGYPGAPGVGGPAGMPGGPPNMMPGGRMGYPGAPGGGPGAGGPGMMAGPGMMGGPGGMGGMDNGPANFETPVNAVNAFLKALRAKDPEALAEATALRAPTESSGPYQKVFTAIVKLDLSPEDMDELSKKFEGMSVVNANPAKSSARAEIIVGKQGQKGEYFTRKITVRKEKAGWKVLDVAGQREFERPINVRGGGMPGRRRGR